MGLKNIEYVPSEKGAKVRTEKKRQTPTVASSRAMATDADEETIDAIETFGLAGADADAIARGGCGKLGRIKTLDDVLNQLRLNERTERLTTPTLAFLASQRSPACDRSV